MKVLQQTRNKRNLYFKPDRADRNYRDRLLTVFIIVKKNVASSGPHKRSQAFQAPPVYFNSGQI